MEFLDSTVHGFSSFRVGKPNYQAHSLFLNKVELVTDGKGKIVGVTNPEKLLFANVPDSAENVQILEVGEKAFSRCTHLRSIQFSGNLEYIGREAFLGDASLESIQLPDSLYELDERAFSGSGLKSFVLPKEVKEIPSRCFENCKSLRSFVVNGKLEKLGAMAFNGCSSLFSIDLGFSLKEIPDGCFMNSGLHSISLPHSIRRIGASAFSRCVRLESIYYDGTVEDFRRIDFGMYWNRGIPEACTLFIKNKEGLWDNAFGEKTERKSDASGRKSDSSRKQEEQAERANGVEELRRRLELLGLDHLPTLSELNSAYRQKARKFHPDMISGLGLDGEFLDFASKKFRELTEAYEYLKKKI